MPKPTQSTDLLTNFFKSVTLRFVATDPYHYCATATKLTLPPQSLIGLVLGFRVTPKTDNFIYWHSFAKAQACLEFI